MFIVCAELEFSVVLDVSVLCAEARKKGKHYNDTLGWREIIWWREIGRPK